MPLTSQGINEVQTNGYANFDYLAVGESSATFSKTDTDLGDETERVAVGALSISADTAIIEALFSNEQGNPSGGTIYEIGVYKTLAGSDLLYREVVERAKTTAKSLLVSITEVLDNA